MSLVIVKFQGDLGNQMFQYALGCAMVKGRRCVLRFDTREMGTRITRRGEGAVVSALWVFGIETLEPDVRALRMFEYTDAPGLSARIWQRIRRALRPRAIVHEGIDTSPAILTRLPPRVYLDGYWQAEDYFRGAASDLREAFRPTTPAPDGVDRFTERIATRESVAVHVRRGDYVENPDAAAFHGVCSLAYYRKAMSLFRERVASPRFHVFSDDPHWALDNLCRDPDVELVPPELSGERGEWHQRLMSLCAHQIVANSSFSWWAAWLNPRPDKIVVAPDPWFAHPSAQWRGRNICPTGWIRLARVPA